MPQDMIPAAMAECNSTTHYTSFDELYADLKQSHRVASVDERAGFSTISRVDNVRFPQRGHFAAKYTLSHSLSTLHRRAYNLYSITAWLDNS